MKCNKCKIEFSKSNFFKNKSKKSGFSNYCKSCSTKAVKLWRNDNPEKRKKASLKNSKKIRLKAKSFVLRYLSFCKCLDCGISDSRVLEFDHIKGIKKNHVSKLISGNRTIKVIKEEIRKCEIVCCNCHRIRTFKRCNSYRNI